MNKELSRCDYCDEPSITWEVVDGEDAQLCDLHFDALYSDHYQCESCGEWYEGRESGDYDMICEYCRD